MTINDDKIMTTVIIQHLSDNDLFFNHAKCAGFLLECMIALRHVLLQLVPVGRDLKPWFRLHMNTAVGGTLNN